MRPPQLSLLDFVILAVTVFAILRGWRLGLSRFGFRLAGLLLGVMTGLWTAGWLVSSRASPLTRLLLEAGCVLAAALIGAALGTRIGSAAGHLLAALHLRVADRIAGAGVRGALALGVCWLLAAAVAMVGPSPAVRAVTGSQVLTTLSARLPAPERIGHDVISQFAVPADLTSLIPVPDAGVGRLSSGQSRSVAQTAAPAVVKIEAAGCAAGVRQGSGFVTAGGLVVTNAHVVAGANSVTVVTRRRVQGAIPVVFDPIADLAVLDVPGLSQRDLALAASPAPNGTPGVALGYPGGGPLTAVPAVVLQRLPVLGPRVASVHLSTREVYRLKARIRPGDSGGPLLDRQGRVIGVVDARSLTDPDVGYALTLTALRADLATARTPHGEVGTGSCGSLPAAATRRLGG